MDALLYARSPKTVRPRESAASRPRASAREPLVAAERDLGPDARAGVGRALDAEPALERLDAVDEPAQARPARGVRAADTVVDHLHARDGVAAPDSHLDRRRLRVLGDVGQRLCDDVVRSRLDLRREALVELVRHVDGERGAAGERLERRPE